MQPCYIQKIVDTVLQFRSVGNAAAITQESLLKAVDFELPAYCTMWQKPCDVLKGVVKKGRSVQRLGTVQKKPKVWNC